MIIRIASEQDMERVFAMRFEVFVGEQNVPPELELDDEDAHALHIIAEEDGVAIGCARVIFSGREAHIGRLAVKKAYRGRYVGLEICRFIIENCFKNKCEYIWLNSQLHAVGFYEKLGFKAQGDVFVEAGIEHIKMEIRS